jgi:hypothetical protein
MNVIPFELLILCNTCGADWVVFEEILAEKWARLRRRYLLIFPLSLWERAGVREEIVVKFVAKMSVVPAP